LFDNASALQMSRRNEPNPASSLTAARLWFKVNSKSRGLGANGDRQRLLPSITPMNDRLPDFGSRHILYEFYYAGDPSMISAGFHREFDKQGCIDRVKEFLAATQT